MSVYESPIKIMNDCKGLIMNDDGNILDYLGNIRFQQDTHWGGTRLKWKLKKWNLADPHFQSDTIKTSEFLSEDEFLIV